MPPIDPTKLRPGMKIVLENDLWVVTDYQHRTPGNLRSFVVTKIKNLRDGRTTERTFRGAADWPHSAEFEQKTCVFLYRENENFVFMDNTTYDQFNLTEEFLGFKANFLTPDSEAIVGFWNGNPVDVVLPSKMTMKVVDTMDDIARGNSANNITKEATTDTGLVIQVPPFVKTGESVIVSTEDGSYVGRA